MQNVMRSSSFDLVYFCLVRQFEALINFVQLYFNCHNLTICRGFVFLW
uniref:Uncharacterized protein n=1 Tax=Arundo donax TaxID=35708 RepID=A0A0A9B0W2_ARUDO